MTQNIKHFVIGWISLMHFVQGLLLKISNHTADGVSAMVSLIKVFGPTITPYLLMGAAISAFFAIFYVDRRHILLGITFKLPQLIILILVTLGSLQVTYNGAYGDGTIRNFYFIFIDQVPSITLALIYAFAL